LLRKGGFDIIKASKRGSPLFQTGTDSRLLDFESENILRDNRQNVISSVLYVCQRDGSQRYLFECLITCAEERRYSE